MSGQLLSSKVVVVEEEPKVRGVPGLPTSVAGMVGITERTDCAQGTCAADQVFPTSSRTPFAPTFGMGFTFYVSRWMSFGLEWRGLPVSRNLAGFDNRGDGPGGRFPDRAVDDQDQELKFNQMLSLSWGFYLPMDYKISE